MAIIEVIKYEGGNNCLVWKHPKEDFNTSAELIVHESQEAIVFRDGISKRYTKGKHIIETENVPGIRKITSLLTGGVSPYHYEVFFVNKAISMNIYWGSASPITVQDPAWQVPFHMRAYGRFAVRVDDSSKFLAKLVGTTTYFTQKTLSEYFRGFLMSRIKTYMSNLMVSQQISILNINAYLGSLGDGIKQELGLELQQYGLEVVNFFFESISIEEDEQYEKLRAAMTNRGIRIIEGMDKATEQSFEIMKIQAANQGQAGPMQQMVSGIYTGAAIAPVMGSMMGNALAPAVNATTNSGVSPQHSQFSMGVLPQTHIQEEQKSLAPILQCPYCGKENPINSKYCNDCGRELATQKREAINCPVCGMQNPAGSKFCNECGTGLEEI